MVSSVKEIPMHAYQFQTLKWILKIKGVNVNWVTEVFLELVSQFLDLLLLVANYIQNNKDLDGFSPTMVMMVKWMAQAEEVDKVEEEANNKDHGSTQKVTKYGLMNLIRMIGKGEITLIMMTG